MIEPLQEATFSASMPLDSLGAQELISAVGQKRTMRMYTTIRGPWYFRILRLILWLLYWRAGYQHPDYQLLYQFKGILNMIESHGNILAFEMNDIEDLTVVV